MFSSDAADKQDPCAHTLILVEEVGRETHERLKKARKRPLEITCDANDCDGTVPAKTLVWRWEVMMTLILTTVVTISQVRAVLATLGTLRIWTIRIRLRLGLYNKGQTSHDLVTILRR